MKHQAAVVTCSDRAFRGEYADRSGPIIQAALRDAGFAVGDVVLVPDDVEAIQRAIGSFVQAGVRLVVTTGGTGVAPRDVTVEATKAILDFEIPGIAEEIRRVGLAATPYASLSRGLAGVVVRDENRALVVNAPGSTGGAKDTVRVLEPIVEHLIGQLDGITNH